MDEPTRATLKKLFGLSRQACFYRGCEAKIADVRWPTVNGEVAHIRGERPGSARYDPGQSGPERQAFENLMVLCPGCHKRVDDLEPDDHPVERLEEMRRRHLEHEAATPWATDNQLEHFVGLALIAYRRTQPSSETGSPVELTSAEVQRRATEAWATLVRVERDRGTGGIDVINDSTEPLGQPALTAGTGPWRGGELADLRPASVEAGTTWRAGFLGADHLDPTRAPYRVELAWTDQSGSRRVAQYDL